MTHHPADARPSCMVAALDTIRAAQKLKLEPGSKTRVRETLPDLYWSLIAEAAIYADLARADYATGITAGTHMTERDARIQKRREHFSERIRRRDEARVSSLDGTTEEDHAGHGCSFDRTAVPPFVEGHRVRVTRGDWAGRCGTVSAIYGTNHPPIVDVTLDQTVWGGESVARAIVIAVLSADLELIDGAAR